MNARTWHRNGLASSSLTIAFAALVGVLGTLSAGNAVGQTRAALVRDVDTPALQPFRGGASFSLCCINDQRLITTVPAGKRLVIEYVSYYGSAVLGDQFIFAALRSGQFGTLQQVFQINPPHPAASSGFVVQDGSMPVRIYFEAGEEVWLSASHTSGTAATINVQVQGYYVTP